MDQRDMDHRDTDRKIEDYKQLLFEAAAEYGKAGRAAYEELTEHIDESLENGQRPKDIITEIGDPETAIRKILRADGKATYPLSKIMTSGVLLALWLGFLFGISSLLMPLGSRMGGMFSISGDSTPLPYTAARCEQYLNLVPGAPDCRQAAMIHHYDEMTGQRLYFAIFCLICLGIFWLAVRGGWVHLLPRKTLLLLASVVYIAVGGLMMLIALGELSAGRNWGWLGDFLTGVPAAIVGVLMLAYYLGYISRPHHSKTVALAEMPVSTRDKTR